MKILCVCLSPSIQRTLVFDQFAAGQVNRTKNFIQNAGGKAINTARVIEQLAPESAVCIFPLAKQNAGEFLSLLKKDGINSKTVPVPLRARTCWTVLSAHGKTTEIIAEEPVSSDGQLFEKREKQLLKLIKKEASDGDALVLSGSAPQCWNQDIYSKIAEKASAAGLAILLDFKGPALLRCLDELKNCTNSIFVKINMDEFTETFSQSLLEPVAQRFPNVTFIVTDGKLPTHAASSKMREQTFESKEIPVVNTTACGDSFNAGFIVEFVKSRNFESAVQEGIRCASLNAQTVVPGSLV